LLTYYYLLLRYELHSGIIRCKGSPIRARGQ
jgi:hypothetical protein